VLRSVGRLGVYGPTVTRKLSVSLCVFVHRFRQYFFFITIVYYHYCIHQRLWINFLRCFFWFLREELLLLLLLALLLGNYRCCINYSCCFSHQKSLRLLLARPSSTSSTLHGLHDSHTQGQGQQLKPLSFISLELLHFGYNLITEN
jgi:hypothetical protein